MGYVMGEQKIVKGLKKLIDEYGTQLINEPRQLRALLMDFYPEKRREVRLLSTVADEGLAKELFQDGRKASLSLLIPQMANKLYKEEE